MTQDAFGAPVLICRTQGWASSFRRHFSQTGSNIAPGTNSPGLEGLGGRGGNAVITVDLLFPLALRMGKFQCAGSGLGETETGRPTGRTEALEGTDARPVARTLAEMRVCVLSVCQPPVPSSFLAGEASVPRGAGHTDPRQGLLASFSGSCFRTHT